MMRYLFLLYWLKEEIILRFRLPWRFLVANQFINLNVGGYTLSFFIITLEKNDSMLQCPISRTIYLAIKVLSTIAGDDTLSFVLYYLRENI